MQFSLFGLVRLVVLLGLAAFLAAVGVSRLAPDPGGGRVEAVGGYGVVNGFMLHPAPDDPEFLDTRSGALRGFVIPRGDRVDYASCSPWRDAGGHFQLVGRWSRQAGEGVRQHGEEFGLARYALPGGRVLDRVPLDVVPLSYPCWFPGRAARVLFAAGDGHLYRVDFEDGDSAEPPPGEPRVRRVDWRCPAPGPLAAVKDPFWPRDPRLGGRLLASLEYHDPSDPLHTTTRLWWLSLDVDGLAVVAAGPLAVDPKPVGVEPRHPVLGNPPGGPLILAYLDQSRDQRFWDLWLAPVAVDPRTGTPSVAKGSARVVTGDQILTPPVFSADGRSVFGVLHGDGGHARVARFPAFPPATAAAAVPDASRG